MKFSKESLRKLVEFVDGDGYTIFEDKAFLEMGFPVEFVAKYTVEHKSDFSHPKGMIFANDGGPVKSVRGVYGLRFVQEVANLLGLPSSAKIGRGFVCREMCAKIEEYARNMEAVS